MNKSKNLTKTQKMVRKIFERVNPNEFQNSFKHGIKSATEQTKVQVITIDGKTLRSQPQSVTVMNPFSKLPWQMQWMRQLKRNRTWDFFLPALFFFLLYCFLIKKMRKSI